MGLVFGVFVSNTFGVLRGWGLVMLSGFLGNLLNGWVQMGESFRSLGASTAVFGMLGLLVGAGVTVGWRSRSYRRGLRALVPVLAGIMIFSMTGIGGEGTDTMAHLTGMLCGMILGGPVAWMIGHGGSTGEERFV